MLDAGEHFYSLEGNSRGGINSCITGQFKLSERDWQFVPDVWTHVAASFDGSGVKIYKDGRLTKMRGIGELFTISQSLVGEGRLGGNARFNGGFWHGLIDEVAIWNRALSSDEIIRASGPPTPVPINQIPFDQLALLEYRGNLDVGALRDDVRAFSDHNYVYFEVPDQLQGYRFIRTARDRYHPYRFTVQQSGYVFVTTIAQPGNDLQRTAIQSLVRSGWLPTELTFRYRRQRRTLVRVWMKKLTAGTNQIPGPDVSIWAGTVLAPRFSVGTPPEPKPVYLPFRPEEPLARVVYDGSLDVDTLDEGVLAFSNRQYKFLNVPFDLRGLKFIRHAGGAHKGYPLTVLKEGLLLVATWEREPADNPLSRSGWQPTGMTFYYNDRGGSRLRVWIKKVEEGTVNIPNLPGFIGTIAIAPSFSVVAPAACQWIDLLELVRPDRDAVNGKWTLAGDTLVADATPAARISLPYKPPEEYDFLAEFSVSKDPSCIAQLVSTAQVPFTWSMNAGSPRRCRLEDIDGHSVIGNTTLRPIYSFKPGQKYTSVVQVRKDRVRCLIDGQLIAEYKTDYSNMSRNGKWAMPDQLRLGLGTWDGPTTFHRLAICEVTGRGANCTGQTSADSWTENISFNRPFCTPGP